MAHRFTFTDRVQFADTDMAGIVHFSNYFRYMERAEHAFFRSLDMSIWDISPTIPDGEHVITYLMKVKYADPTELAQTLGTFVVQSPGQYTNITALPKAGALLITENTAVIRQVLRIVHEVDVPPAEVASKFFELENGDAEDVQKKLEEILNKTSDKVAAGGVSVAGGNRPVTPAPRIPTFRASRGPCPP